jgi:23S rRNA (adenine2503-C2)-methyltransferase
MDLDVLETKLAELGQPGYRLRQIWRGACTGAPGFGAMTDLPLALRAELEETLAFSTLTLEREVTARDGTVKALLRTVDGRAVEAVLMVYRDGRRSLCLSSQSGCPLTCTFCATGQMRFGRNLTRWEILDQALHFRRSGPVDHAVFMGMGEPMMNIENVLGACARLPDIGIGHRRTAVSTVGWIPGIAKLAASPMPIRLALSLHAADPALRSQLMPVNDRYPLPEVLAACEDYYERKRRKVFVEYVMLAGVNDSHAQATALAALLDPRKFKVNLIPYNPTDSPYRGSSPKAIDAFRAELERHRIDTTVRLTRGRAIDAACGQLAANERGGLGRAVARDRPATAGDRAAMPGDRAAVGSDRATTARDRAAMPGDTAAVAPDRAIDARSSQGCGTEEPGSVPAVASPAK